MKLYKFRSFHDLDHLLDVLVRRRLYCALPAALNDPFEGVYMSAFYPRTSTLYAMGQSVADQETLAPYPQNQSVTKRARSVWDPSEAGELHRVCSLSASMKDIRLWSNYADGHRGVAIEVEISEGETRLHPVAYIKSLPEHAVHVFDPRPSPEKILTKKTHQWEHEKEYRLLQAEPYFDLGDSPIRVLVGTRIDPAHFELLHALQLPGVEIVPTLLDGDALEVRSAKFGDAHDP